VKQFEVETAVKNAHKTAMKRNPNKLSAPMNRLVKQGRVKGYKHLDYGCGYGTDADILDCWKYDPHFYPYEPEGRFEVITCIYVLNVLPLGEQKKVITKIYDLLEDDGVAYFAVRRDQGVANGFTAKGTYQTTVKLGFDKVCYDSGYDIYMMKKEEVKRDKISEWL
jgi:hypothetical protein